MSPQFLLAALPYVSAGLQVLSGIASLRAGQQNAAYAEAEAKNAMLAGRAEADRTRRLNAYKLGLTRANAGASGVDVSSGSPMEVYLENAKQAELEAQTALYGGKSKAYGLRAQADIYRREGTMGLLGGVAGGLGSLGSTLIPRTP